MQFKKITAIDDFKAQQLKWRSSTLISHLTLLFTSLVVFVLPAALIFFLKQKSLQEVLYSSPDLEEGLDAYLRFTLLMSFISVLGIPLSYLLHKVPSVIVWINRQFSPVQSAEFRQRLTVTRTVYFRSTMPCSRS